MVTDTQVKTGYKQTDIGVVPEDWDMYQTKAITENISNSIKIGPFGSQLKKELLVKSGYKVYGQENVYERDVEIGERYIDENYFRKLKSCELKTGDFVISMMGTIGKCMIMPENMENGIMDSHLLRMKLNRNKINPQLLIQLFNSPIVQNQVMNLSVGGIMSGLSSTIIRKLILPVPKTIEEQNSIAKVMHDTDKFITKLDQLIEKKRNIKQGTMQELLTGKRRLPGFSDEWEKKQIRDLAEIVSGGTPKTSIEEYWDGGILWCTPTDITNCEPKWISSTEKTISRLGLQKSSANILPKGSLLLCSRATIGEVRIASTEFTTNQGFKSLVCNSNVDNEFLYYYILTIKNTLIEKANGSTFLEISKKDLQNITLLVPKKEEQKAIAEVLAAMDEEIMVLENQKNKYLDIKQGMMQQLLTGRIRLI